MNRFITVLFVLIALVGNSNAAILVMSPNGTFTTKTDLATAATAADVVGKTVVVTAPITLTSNINWPADRALEIKPGAIITTTGYTLTINGTFQAPATQVFSGSGNVSGLRESRVDWFGLNTNPGVTDMTSAIQRAIDSLSLSGGEVKISTGIHAISSTINIGNGSVSAASTSNNIKIFGAGSGSSDEIIAGNNTGTVLKWIGVNAGQVVKVNGPISGLQLKDFAIDCNNKASTGLVLRQPQFSTFENIVVKNHITFAPFYDQFAIDLQAYPLTTATYSRGAISNEFRKVIIRSPGADSNGILIGSPTWTTGDAWDVLQTNFYDCTFAANSSDVSHVTTAMKLQFTDNISFYGCILSQYATLSGFGKALTVAPPILGTGNTNFPSEISFFHTAVIGGVEVVGTWTPGIGYSRGGVYFSPFPVSDGEPLPSLVSPYFWGITTTGRPFGLGYGGSVLRNSGATNVAIPNASATTFLFPFALSDPDNFLYNGGYVKPLTTGLYQINANVEWAANATGLRKISIFKYNNDNTTHEEISTSIVTPVTGATTGQSISIVDESQNPNNYYYLQVYQTSGGNLDILRTNNIVARSPRISCYRIR